MIFVKALWAEEFFFNQGLSLSSVNALRTAPLHKDKSSFSFSCAAYNSVYFIANVSH